jgi:hypothetical protein
VVTENPNQGFSENERKSSDIYEILHSVNSDGMFGTTLHLCGLSYFKTEEELQTRKDPVI